MHTDEYGITLSREVHIARKKVEEHLRAVQSFEAQFGMPSELFLQKLSSGELSANSSDYAAWRDQHAALERWKQQLQEFEKLHKAWR